MVEIRPTQLIDTTGVPHDSQRQQRDPSMSLLDIGNDRFNNASQLQNQQKEEEIQRKKDVGVNLRHSLDDYQNFYHTREMLNDMLQNQEKKHFQETNNQAAAASGYMADQADVSNMASNMRSQSIATTNAATTSLNQLSRNSLSMKGAEVISSERVQRAYQSFVEAENMNDALMPTISAPIPVLTDTQVKQYFVDKAQDEHSKAQAKNKMPLHDFFTTDEVEHSSTEKIELLETKKFKLFESLQTVYELQDQYHLNEEISRDNEANPIAQNQQKSKHTGFSFGSNRKKPEEETKLTNTMNNNTFQDFLDLSKDDQDEILAVEDSMFQRNMKHNNHRSENRVTHRSNRSQLIIPSYRVLLRPKVYSSEQMKKQYGNISHELGQMMESGLVYFHKNPYSVAMLFYEIAKGTLFDDIDIVRKDFQKDLDLLPQAKRDQIQNSVKLWQQYIQPIQYLNQKLEWGNFLHSRVRKMLLNLSRYNFQHLIMQEHEDPADANRKFLNAFMILIEKTPTADLFHYRDRSDVNDFKGQWEFKWNFQQVIKVLFEGQTRNAEALHTMRTIFKPMYAKLGISSLFKKLNDLDLVNQKESKSEEYNKNIQDIDQARRSLFKKIDIDCNHINLKNEVTGQKEDSIPFSEEYQFPTKVTPHMFQHIKRLTPTPKTTFELLIKPITSIYDEIQQRYGLKKSVPDCQVFVNELFNTNMLTVDVYAPSQLLTHKRGTINIFDQIDDVHNILVRNIITEKVIELCESLLKSLFESEVPFIMRVLIKKIFDKASLNSKESNIEAVTTCAYLITDLISACWLSNGFRWAECVGATPAIKEESLLQGHILLAARLVIETCLTCSELPVPALGENHPTFDIPSLNVFIKQQKPNILHWFMDYLLDDSEIQGLRYPSYPDRNKNRLNDPIYSAGLMRVGDMATLLQLVNWKFIKEKDQDKLMFFYEGIFNKELEKLSNCGIPFESINDGNDCNIKKISKNTLISMLEKLRTNLDLDGEVTKILGSESEQTTENIRLKEEMMKFWNQQNLQQYDKVNKYYANKSNPNIHLFKTQWQTIARHETHFAINLNNKPKRLQFVEFCLGESFASNKGQYMLQHALFRLQKPCSTNPPVEFFEDQYLLFYSQNKQINDDLDRERKTFKKNLLWNFVCTNYEPNLKQDYIQKLMNQGPFLPEPDVIKAIPAISETVSDQTRALMKNKYFFSANGEDEKTFNAFSGMNQFGGVSFQAPTKEEIRTNNSHDFNKLRFCEVLERFLKHFQDIMSSNAIMLNRIYDRRRLHMGTGENITLTDVYNSVESVEQLLQLIEEDVITMECNKTDLMTEILLLKLYFNKLPSLMQSNLMSLLKLSMAQDKRISELVYVQQSGEIGLAISQLQQFQTEQIRQQLLLESIFQQVKINRFLSRDWSKKFLKAVNIDDLRRYIVSLGTPSMLSQWQEASAQAQRTHTMSTNNVPSMVLNAERMSNMDGNSLIKKELIEQSVTTLQTYVDESDCLAFKSIIKYASTFQDLSQQLFGSSQILQGIDNHDQLLQINTLSSNLFNDAILYCASLMKQVIINDSYIFEQARNEGTDHFFIFEIFSIYKYLVRECIDQETNTDKIKDREFFDSVEENLFRLIIKSVWVHVKTDPQVRSKDSKIKKMITEGLGSFRPPNHDDFDFDLDAEEENDLYFAAIQTLSQVNFTDDAELKALTVERSIKIAVESYEASNLFQPMSEDPSIISPENLSKLINYIVGSCYKRSPDFFTLYMDLVYVCMILQKGYNFRYVKSVASELFTLLEHSKQGTTSRNSISHDLTLAQL